MIKIDKNNIIVSLDAKNKEEVINYLSKILFNNNYLYDLGKYREAVYDRESMMSTNIGKNVAIPHGKTDAVKISGYIVAKLKNPIKWDHNSEENVNLVFMLAVDNNGAVNDHIKMLAEISQKLMDDDFISEIQNAKTIEEIYKILGGE